MWCGLSWVAFLVLCFAGGFACAVSYGLGRRAATRAHWKMLHRVGSRVLENDN